MNYAPSQPTDDDRPELIQRHKNGSLLLIEVEPDTQLWNGSAYILGDPWNVRP
jgi:hypothetical protein